jgi:hypothetical protein
MSRVAMTMLALLGLEGATVSDARGRAIVQPAAAR